MKKRTWAIAAVATSAIAMAAVPAVNAMAEDPQPSSAGHWCDTDEPQPLYELVSSDGTGRLYTLNKGEADDAVSKHHMTLEEEPVAYLPCREFSESVTWHRLKPSETADAWLLTRGDSDEAEQLEAEGWVNEGVTGFAYRDSEGKILLNRYTNGEEWRVAPESEEDALSDEGYKVDGPLGYAYEEAP
ncbi:MAG: hypothetical protein ACRDXX_19380 [Stackebrandtia sp.]